LNKFLTKQGFKRHETQPCLYVKKDKIIVLIYVDDILYASCSDKRLARFEGEIGKAFNVKTSQVLEKFLGLEINVQQNENQMMIKIKVENKINKLVETLELNEAKPLEVPIAPGAVLEKTVTEPLNNICLFQSITGSLAFINNSLRLDVSFAVNQLAQQMANPNLTHLRIAKKVVRYLNHSKNMGLVFKTNPEIKNIWQIKAFCDANYNTSNDGKSTIGYIIFVNGNVFKYKTKKLKTVTESTCETEFMSIYFTFKELMSLKNILDDMKIEYSTPLVLNDNQSAIALTKNNKEIDRD
jgi:hypothetical protein